MAQRDVRLIPDDIAKKVLLFAPAACLESLCYIQVPFFGYDETLQVGKVLVHIKLAEEVLEIFFELSAARFPIEKICLIENYVGSDDASMADNNSSAFCYRPNVTTPSVLSKHSQGKAIDINPIYNPYVKKDGLLPPGGKDYLD